MRLKTLVLIAVVLLAVVVAVALYRSRPGGGGAAAVLGDPAMNRLVSGAPQGLSVSSVVPNGSRVPVEYTCDGANRPLPLRVEGVPGGARSLLVVMYDPDAPGGTFVHWLLVVLDPPEALDIPGAAAETATGINDFGRVGYGGPCPPPGDKPHRYYILVLALDRYPGTSQPVPQGFNLSEALDWAEGHVVSWGYLVYFYSR